uniref:Uncharacterized protein n=1 Tax=Tanacetum cinerariifolium TaxID=118510 RepID=A0A699GWY9_TANCI|nr:hypothetical protein [Tanacetum cinerariifolium]
MADSANDARKTIVSNLQRELEAEATLANTMLGNLTRYSEQMRIHEIQITMLQNMPTMSFNSYWLYALLMTHEEDICTTNNLIRARQELLRSIAEKQNFVDNYNNPENVRSNVLKKLQEALDEEAILEEQILSLMYRFADRFTDRRVKINNLMVLHDHPLTDYGKYALGCMIEADMKKCVYLKSVRDKLLRSMEEKRQLMTNYRDM